MGKTIKLTNVKLKGWNEKTVIPPIIKGNKNNVKNFLSKYFSSINWERTKVFFLLSSFLNNLYLFHVHDQKDELSHVPKVYWTLS